MVTESVGPLSNLPVPVLQTPVRAAVGTAAANDSAQLQRDPTGSNYIILQVIPGGPGFDLLCQPF